MKALTIIFSGLCLIQCTIVDQPIAETKKEESCDYSICEEGRLAIDTIYNSIGRLLQNGEYAYIQVTGNAPQPDSLLIACMDPSIVLPVAGTFVVFSAFTKDHCSDESMILKDSIQLTNIDILDPVIQGACQSNIIISDQFDRKGIDDALNIHHLNIEDDCLNMLISYRGNCEAFPALSLHASGDIKFDLEVDVFLKGDIIDDCSMDNYALIKFNLANLKDIVGDLGDDLTLYFASQGFLRIGYSLN